VAVAAGTPITKSGAAIGAVTGSVARCPCLALHQFFTFLGMIYRAVPPWDTFYLNELTLLCVFQ